MVALRCAVCGTRLAELRDDAVVVVDTHHGQRHASAIDVGALVAWHASGGRVPVRVASIRLREPAPVVAAR